MEQTCISCQNFRLYLPDNSNFIKVGDVIVLGRFESERWCVCFGWYSYDGNRKICGWYLKSLIDSNRVKSIQDTDLYDIYVIES